MKRDVLSAISKERRRQDEKWKDYCDANHTNLEWLAILAEEVGELSKATNKLDFHPYTKAEEPPPYDDVRNELTHVAAVAVAWLEQFYD